MLGVMAVRLLWTACCMVAQFRAAQAAHRWAELEAQVYGGSTHLSSPESVGAQLLQGLHEVDPGLT